MDLTTDFEKATGAYESHAAYASLRAKKEVWTSGHYYNVEPFDFQRGGFQQGKTLVKKPASTKRKYCYVFDDNTLLAIKQGLSIDNQFNEEFLFWENGLLKSCLYANNKSLINVKSRILANDKIQEVFLMGKRGFKHETYFYEENLLTRIRVEQEAAQQPGVAYNVMFKYDNGRLIEIVNEFDNDYREVRYLISE